MQLKSVKTPVDQLRLARVERDEVIETAEDENSHLWAVAYSDLLMVLLSFFILFFSVDSQQRDNLIIDLVRGIASEARPALEDKQMMNTKALYADLAKLNMSIVQDKESLTLNFANELFKPGKYSIEPTQAAEITKVLAHLEKYKDKINIYFEGHADSTPILHGKNKVVEDNFVLSSLRATRALQLAKKMGFPEKQLFAQASSSNTRNLRTLSLRVEPLAIKAAMVEMPEKDGL